MAGSSYAGLLRTNRNFRLLWIAQIVSEMGDWLYTVSVYSLLLEFTGSAKSIALAFVLQVLPQFFIAPVAGIVNDHLSRKRVMIFADWTRAGIVLCMALVRTPGLVWLLYSLLFVETLLWGLFEPGRSAVLPNIVEQRDIVRANTLASITWSFNFASGAALGGLLAAYLGRNAVFAIDSLSFVASALLIRRMHFAEPHAENLAHVRKRDLVSFAPTIEGARYVRKNPRLAATLFVKCGLGLLGANWVIIPIFGERIFPVYRPGFDAHKAGMLGMSLLMTCRGIGAILGPVAASIWAGDREKRLRWGIGLGFLAAACGYVGLGFASTFAAAGAGIVLAHSGLSVIWVFSSTMLQLQTEDRFRGRVFSAEWALGVITMSASSWAAGVLADRGLPVSTIALLVGLSMLAPALLWAWAQKYWRAPSRVE